MTFIHLKPGKDKPVQHHHPWIFSGAIEKIEPDAPGQPGEVVVVKSSKGEFLARGYYNPHSQIAVRLLEWQESQAVDEQWWRRKLREAVERRRELFNRTDTDSFRLVHAEGDWLPGLIVDKYGAFLAVQSFTAGIDKVKSIMVDELNQLLQPAGIYERGDLSTRKLEGLASANGPLAGEPPPDYLEIKENGFRFLVNIPHGQKTGFYLDQRENRKVVAGFARDKAVLDGFAYSGSFGIYVLAAGAKSVVSIDSSTASLELLKKNYELNGFAAKEEELVRADVFHTLRKYRDDGRMFDMVILDPPKLAPTKAQVERAQRAYKDLNLMAMNVLAPNGILATFSCSSGVSAELFQNIVAWAALDAGREAQILTRLSQGEDHPVRLAFPESQYLKGLICRVI